MVLKQRHYNGGDCWGHTAVLISVVLSQSRRLPLLQVVSNNKSFSVGVQSPTEINAPRGCAVILRRICQLSLTRITHQVSRAFDLNLVGKDSHFYKDEQQSSSGFTGSFCAYLLLTIALYFSWYLSSISFGIWAP